MGFEILKPHLNEKAYESKSINKSQWKAKQMEEEKATHLLRGIITKRHTKDITVKRHINGFFNLPHKTTRDSSMTHHCRIQHQTQNNNHSCNYRRRR